MTLVAWRVWFSFFISFVFCFQGGWSTLLTLFPLLYWNSMQFLCMSEKKIISKLRGYLCNMVWNNFFIALPDAQSFFCHFNFEMELVLVYFLYSFVHQNNMLWRSHPLMYMLQYIFEPRGISNVNTWFCSLHAWSRMTEQRLTGGWLMSVGELMTTANIHSSVFLQVHLSRAEFQNA